LSCSTKPTNFSDEYVARKADLNDCDVMWGNDHKLLIDIDSFDGMTTFEHNFSIMKEHIKVNGHQILRSKSGKRHIIVDLESPLPIEQRILLQAALGSDPKRELLSYIGHTKGQGNAVVLFRPRPKLLTGEFHAIN
jgi:hypothetical protein